ncbi:hypothetical protein IB256_09165 [Pseudomonas sp. PDM17]|uniref:hypothetical protein n=1 Tax=Pseudomonas sp. PDM17 TaxID=2769285 RepID=UPI0017821836|nr:hypothetical protein [Pseudomonas sp. PDM17]MBD9500944.1 hypothetical protein [Pseudomonas sp. PDM17]
MPANRHQAVPRLRIHPRPDRAFCIEQSAYSGVLLLAPCNHLMCKPLCAEPLADSAKQAWNLLHEPL